MGTPSASYRTATASLHNSNRAEGLGGATPCTAEQELVAEMGAVERVLLAQPQRHSLLHTPSKQSITGSKGSSARSLRRVDHHPRHQSVTRGTLPQISRLFSSVPVGVTLARTSRSLRLLVTPSATACAIRSSASATSKSVSVVAKAVSGACGAPYNTNILQRAQVYLEGFPHHPCRPEDLSLVESAPTPVPPPSNTKRSADGMLLQRLVHFMTSLR